MSGKFDRHLYCCTEADLAVRSKPALRPPFFCSLSPTQTHLQARTFIVQSAQKNRLNLTHLPKKKETGKTKLQIPFSHHTSSQLCKARRFGRVAPAICLQENCSLDAHVVSATPCARVQVHEVNKLSWVDLGPWRVGREPRRKELGASHLLTYFWIRHHVFGMVACNCFGKKITNRTLLNSLARCARSPAVPVDSAVHAPR